MELRKILGKILQPLSKILGFGFLCYAILGNLSYADFTGRLPSSLTLQGGQSQIHNAIMDCSSYWECVFGNYSYSFTYSTNGNTDSSLTLNGTLPPNPASQTKSKPFFIGNMTINPHSNLTMQDFESFNLGGSLNINGGSLVFQNGDFATLFGTNISVSNGGKLGVVANGFTNRGNMSANNATISIIPTSARNYGNIYNDNGDITIGTDLLSIGQKEALAGASPSSVANIVNNGGKLTIQGNLYNGGQENPNFDCRVGGCGGGNITNNGGEIIIQGRLTSESKDGQNSTISIYGGTLSTTNGVQNRAGSTITIGADNNGNLGQIIGNVSNNGAFIIDASGASDGNHTFITGTLSGSAPTLRNGNTEFASSNINGGKLAVSLNNDKIARFTHTLSQNQSATLNTLGNKIYTTNGASTASLTQLAQNLNQDIFSTFVSSPFAIISYLKSSLDSSLQPSTNRPKSTDKSNALSLNLIGSGLSLDASTQGVKSAFGGSGGVKISFAKDLILASPSRTRTLPATLALNAGYTYTTLKTSSQSSMLNQDISLSAQTAGIEAILLLRFADKRFGFSTNLGGFMSFLEAHRTLDSSLISTKSPLKSSFALYQVALDSIFSYDFASFVSANSGLNVLAPYIGLHQSINILPSFAESSDEVTPSQMSLKSNDYTAYHLGLIAGVKYSFLLSRFASNQSLRLNAKMQYEYVAYHSQKSLDFAYIASQSAQNNQSSQSPQSAQNLSFGVPLAHKLNANLGIEKDFANGLNLGLNITFDTLFSSQNTNSTSPETLNQKYYFYGANATLGYRF